MFCESRTGGCSLSISLINSYVLCVVHLDHVHLIQLALALEGLPDFLLGLAQYTLVRSSSAMQLPSQSSVVDDVLLAAANMFCNRLLSQSQLENS